MRDTQFFGEMRALKTRPDKNTQAVQKNEIYISGKKVFAGISRYFAEKGTTKNTVLRKMKAPLIPATP